MSRIKEYMKNRQKSMKSLEKYEDEYDDGFERKIKTHKRRVLIFTLSVVIIAIATAVIIRISIDRKVYDKYEVREEIEMESTYGGSFYEFAGKILHYSNDGIAYIDGKNTIWNQPFEMKNPRLDICEDTVSIAEYQGTAVYIYNKSGALGQITSKYPIESLSISSKGIVALITSDKKVNYIEIYDKAGNELVEGQASLETDIGYPLALGISNDGTKMITSYLYMDGTSVQTKLVFYNFSEVGKNNVDRIVGVFNHYKSTIVPKVEFINNDKAVAYGDNIITLYSVTQKPDKIFEKEFDDKIKSVFYSDKYVGLVLKTNDNDKPYNIIVYDENGKECLNKKTATEYKNIKFDGKNVLLYNDIDIEVIAFNGVVKYKDTFNEEIEDILTTGKAYTYMVVTESDIKKIRLK